MTSFFSSRSETATPKVKEKISFRISGMHCVSCSLNIEGELEDTPGVVSASANYARAVCTVEYDPTMVDTRQIMEIVKKIGYDLTPQEV